MLNFIMKLLKAKKELGFFVSIKGFFVNEIDIVGIHLQELRRVFHLHHLGVIYFRY